MAKRTMYNIELSKQDIYYILRNIGEDLGVDQSTGHDNLVRKLRKVCPDIMTNLNSRRRP